jgi:RHS repeat-associated protein
VKKNDNGWQTYYLRSSVLGGQVVAEIVWASVSWGWNRGYVYLGSQLLAVQYGGVYFVHEDAVTKSKRITNYSGTVTSMIELDPWGADTSRSSNAAFQPKKFTSYERDANGTDEAMFRRYNRWQSRFDQPDPYDGSYDYSNPQSFNRYAYVQGDPVNFVDPSGQTNEATGGLCAAMYSSCSGTGGGGYGGTPFDSGSYFMGGYNDLPGRTGSGLAAFDQRVQTTRDGLRAQDALNHNNFDRLIAILNGNPNVGVSVNGLQLWGGLAVAFVTAYSQPIEIAQRGGAPLGAVGYAVQKGLEAVARLVQKARKPDFYIFSAAPGMNLQGSVAITRASTLTVSLSLTAGNVASGMMGWLLQVDRPRDEAVVGFLTGRSGGADIFWNPKTGWGAGFGAGFIKSPDSPGTRWAVTMGLGLGGGFLEATAGIGPS